MKKIGLVTIILTSLTLGMAAQEIGGAFYNSNNDCIYLFDLSGKNYTVYDGAEKTWRDWKNVSGFADGKGGLGAVADVLYNPANDNIYLFDIAGDTYKVWDGQGKKWVDSKPLSNFGDGKCPIKAIGACFYNSNNESFYLFSADGKEYTVWDSPKKTWRDIKPVTAFGDGKAPLDSVGAAFYNKANNEIYLFSSNGKTYTAYDGTNKTWRPLKPVTALGNGAMPSLKSASSPKVTPAPKAPSPATGKKVVDTKFNKLMVFDHQRYYDATNKQYVAGSLIAPFDDTTGRAIPELTEGNPGFVKDAFISLDLAVGADQDTITTASLVLKKKDGEKIRTISNNGRLQFLGNEGFVYISEKYDFGYFFSSQEHKYGEAVAYAVQLERVTKKSQLNW